MPSFAVEGWPSEDRRVVDFITAEAAEEAAEEFKRRHGCEPEKVDGKRWEPREGTLLDKREGEG